MKSFTIKKCKQYFLTSISDCNSSFKYEFLEEKKWDESLTAVKTRHADKKPKIIPTIRVKTIPWSALKLFDVDIFTDYSTTVSLHRHTFKNLT